MSGIKIIGTGHYLPEHVVTNDDFTKVVDTSDEWIRTRTGIQRRRVSVGEPTWMLGANAARQAIEMAGIDAMDIDMIVVTTVTADFYCPSVACLVQREIGAKNAFAMDVNVACTGVTYTLDMARRYLATGDVETVLLIGAESLTQITNFEDRATCVLFGDGAGACIVQRSEKPFGSYIRSDADGAHFLYGKRTRRKLPFDHLPLGEEILPFPIEYEEGLWMNGKEVYKFATKAMPLAVENACEKMGLTPQELDLIIPHQANIRILQTSAKNLGVPMEKIHVNIHEYANSSSATILIGLDEAVRSGKLNRGGRVCLVGFGGGLTYGANVFEF